MDVLASVQTFPVVQAFTGPCNVGHTSWPEHAQRFARSWVLIGVNCALCAIRHVSRRAPCAINSSHHIIICTNCISRSSACVGHGNLFTTSRSGLRPPFMDSWWSKHSPVLVILAPSLFSRSSQGSGSGSVRSCYNVHEHFTMCASIPIDFHCFVGLTCATPDLCHTLCPFDADCCLSRLHFGSCLCHMLFLKT